MPIPLQIFRANLHGAEPSLAELLGAESSLAEILGAEPSLACTFPLNSVQLRV